MTKVYYKLDGDPNWHGPDDLDNLAMQGSDGIGAVAATRPVGVGDVASNAVGSGARFNTGKPPIELIPLAVVASCEQYRGAGRTGWTAAMESLGRFQMGGGREDLLDAAAAVGLAWDECAAVLDYGRRKYAEWNWAKGQAWSVPIGSGGRHALAALRGEMVDAESGLTHRGHFLCNIVFLLWFIDDYPQGDDRRRAPVVSS